VKVASPALLPPMPYNHQKLREEIDNYKETVWATVAFVHECRWSETSKCVDAGVRFGLGRPMTRTDASVVTPDAVIQRRPNQGTVAEVKHTFPPSDKYGRREEIFQQLKSYDDQLLGWWTQSKNIERHDIVLLTHSSHVVDAVDYLTKDLAGKKLGTFERPLAIVGYYRSEQNELYLTLKKEHGTLLDGKLGEKLRKSVAIPVRHIELESHPVRFNDSPPPVPYILWLLWDYVFPERAAVVERDRSKNYKPIPVTIEQLTSDLQKFYGYEPDETGNRGIPQSDWIESALDTLVSLRMAQRGGAPRNYIIRFKSIQGDILQRFGRLYYDHQQTKARKKKKKKQLELF
jgi:hypothetical protein